MFRIKICGITTIHDGQFAATAGADAIGLNFYAKSRRYVDPQKASEIASNVPQGTAIVGLFVNSSAAAISEVNEAVPLSVIQLHGDEPPELLAELRWAPVLRAFRFGPEGIKPIAEYLDRCDQLDVMPQAVLIDAYDAGKFGGTGKQADWQRLADERSSLPDVPLILAGGLTPDNVAEAIRIVQPHGVDVSSGVEGATVEDESPRKDSDLVSRFVAAAEAAL